MKAYRLEDFTGFSDLRLKEEPEPRPGRGEIRVRVRAVSLNYRDLAMINGRYPVAHHKGLIPTSDGAGEVIEVGESVHEFQVGDRVMGTFHPRWFGGRMPRTEDRPGYGADMDGWLVAQKVLSREAVVRIPAGFSLEEAATLPCAGLTAWSALTTGLPLRSGHTVLTQGTGGVSIFAIGLAKAMGARVIATTSSAEKAQRLRQLGADHVLNYRETPDWGHAARALEMTTLRPAIDRVFDFNDAREAYRHLATGTHFGKVVIRC